MNLHISILKFILSKFLSCLKLRFGEVIPLMHLSFWIELEDDIFTVLCFLAVWLALV